MNKTYDSFGIVRKPIHYGLDIGKWMIYTSSTSTVIGKLSAVQDGFVVLTPRIKRDYPDGKEKYVISKLKVKMRLEDIIVIEETTEEGSRNYFINYNNSLRKKDKPLKTPNKR